jgi:hypothetical protein
MHDEPMRGCADEVKRIATDEGEFPEGARFYDPRIAVFLDILEHHPEIPIREMSSLPTKIAFL